ncbi:MAG: 4-amino-4-deoxychorismate lyase [Actinobacteria bacterium]|nr:MAG: 4-amino-4-deoxychorismate lyase [Actinomycetota bacterium]
MELACLDGAVLPVAEARIPVTDAGLLRGDGVFEVVRLYGGRPYALDEHLARMTRSADNLRLPFDASAVEADARALLDAAAPGDGLLRLVVTRGGHRLALLEPLPDYPPAISLGFVEYVPPRVLDGIKSLSYGANMLATRLAQERGFDEALLVTPHGRVLEGPTSSIFVAFDGRLVTPPLDEHVLDSITRRRVLEVTDAVERPVTVDELRSASGAFLASTTREVQPVHHIEDIELDVNDALVREAVQRTREAIAGS